MKDVILSKKGDEFFFNPFFLKKGIYFSQQTSYFFKKKLQTRE